MCPDNPMNRSGPAIYPARAASSGSNGITARNRIYPTFQPAFPILNHHHYLFSGGSQPAEHGFADVATAHWLFAGGAPKENRGRQTYGRSLFHRPPVPGIPRAPFRRRGFAGCLQYISHPHKIIRREQMTPQLHVASGVLSEQVRLLPEHILHLPPVSLCKLLLKAAPTSHPH